MILKRKGFILLLECLQMTGDTEEVEEHCGQETGSRLLRWPWGGSQCWWRRCHGKERSGRPWPPDWERVPSKLIMGALREADIAFLLPYTLVILGWLETAVALPQPGWARTKVSTFVQPGFPALSIRSLCIGTAEKTKTSGKNIRIPSLVSGRRNSVISGHVTSTCTIWVFSELVQSPPSPLFLKQACLTLLLSLRLCQTVWDRLLKSTSNFPNLNCSHLLWYKKVVWELVYSLNTH